MTGEKFDVSTSTAAVAEPDETEIIDSANTEALAWSQAETDEVIPYVERVSRSRWAVLAAALLTLAVAVTLVLLHHEPSPRPLAQHEPPPPPPRGPIDGSYRVDHYRGQGVIRTPSGTISAAGPAYSTVDTEWWAFQSQCASQPCTAVGTRLDDDTHQRAAIARTPNLPAGEATQTLRVIDGQWRSDHPNKVQQACVGAAGSDTWQWSIELTQLPDGTLKGQETDIVESNECSSVGNVITTPVVATRIGEPPPTLRGNNKKPRLSRDPEGGWQDSRDSFQE